MLLANNEAPICYVKIETNYKNNGQLVLSTNKEVDRNRTELKQYEIQLLSEYLQETMSWSGLLESNL